MRTPVSILRFAKEEQQVYWKKSPPKGKGLVYAIVKKDLSKAYVGQTVRSARTRFLEHCGRECKRLSDEMHRSIRKNGASAFQVVVLDVLDMSDLNDAETYYIKVFDTLHPNGYNHDTGGGVNRKFSSVVRKNMRNAQKAVFATDQRKMSQAAMAQKRHDAFVKRIKCAEEIPPKVSDRVHGEIYVDVDGKVVMWERSKVGKNGAQQYFKRKMSIEDSERRMLACRIRKHRCRERWAV